MPHEATVDHADPAFAESAAPPVVRLHSEVGIGGREEGSRKRLKSDDGKDHVPHLRAVKPHKDSFQNGDEFDSDDSEASGNTNDSASAESIH